MKIGKQDWEIVRMKLHFEIKIKSDYKESSEVPIPGCMKGIYFFQLHCFKYT